METLLMKQFIKDLWLTFIERQKVHKAMRILSTQEWSLEFLTALLVRAANIAGKPLEMQIVSPNGVRYIVRSQGAEVPQALQDDDIFNHLDDENRIKAFMEQVK